MIITDLFESAPGANPYGYQVGQTVKLQNGSQGQVVDIFDDSIEVLLPGGRTMTVDFRDAEVLDEYGMIEALGDNRPKLGSKRDQGKSVRQWRRDRGMDESGMAEASNELAAMTTMGMGDPLDFSSDYALYTVQKGRELFGTMRNLYAKANALPPAERSKFYQRLDALAYEGLGDEILRYSKTLTVDDLIAISDVLENYDIMFNTIAIPDELQDAEAAWKQYAAEVALARTQAQPGQTMHERSMSMAESRQVFTEGRHNKLLKENTTYRKFHNLSRLLVERKMSEKEILDLFAAVETGANATGQNRTALGKGKDAVAGAYTSAKEAISGVLDSIQKSTPVAGVDAAYNDATGALRDAVGTNSKVMDAIKKYRLLAKEYPKTQLFVKTALIALTGLATGGAGLPAIAGLTMAVDAAIKGEKLSSIIGKGAGAALMAYGAQEVQAMLSGGAAPVDAIAADPASTFVPGPDLPTYTVQSGDTLSQIAQANDISVQELIGLNPQLAADAGAVGGQNLNPDVIFPGQEITLPPASGADVYAGGVGTNANTMADIAKGNVPDSSITQTGSLERLGQATPSGAGPAAAPTGPTNLAPNFDPANVPQGMTIKYAPPPVSGVELAGMPVVAGQPLNATQMIVANSAMRSGNALDPVIQAAYDLAKRSAVRESVKLIRLPAEQLIDQKLTVMAWALNESVGKAPARSMHLTRRGVLTVIENVDRHRRALLKEFDAAGPDRTNIPAVPRKDMPLAPQDGAVKPGMIGRGLNFLDRAAGKVGGYLSKQAQNFTRKVTAAKLKTEWEQEGHQTDSDYIAAFLTKQGVPQGVVTDVYGQMGIPYTAPVAAPVDGAAAPVDGATEPVAAPVGGAQRQAYAGIDPVTKKPYTGDQLRNKFYPTTPAAPTAPTAPVAPTTATATTTKPAAAGKFPGEDPQGSGYVGRREVARRQAARDAEAAKKPATPNFAQQGAGYKNVTYAPNIKTGISLPKPTAAPAAAPTKTPTQAEKDAYVKSIGAPAMAENRIATALKKPVAEMLQMVETKEDVAKIKQFVDQTFVRYGAVNESAFAVRNQILEHVTQVGAQRRREHARMS